METLLKQFGFDATNTRYECFGAGHINTTFLVETKHQKFIMQKINHAVF